MKMVEAINVVSQSLENIFILDSIPSNIRHYSPLSDRLESDGSNIAGVLAALTEERKNEVELTLSHFIKYLPEKDIQKVWAGHRSGFYRWQHPRHSSALSRRPRIHRSRGNLGDQR